jgi:hypothetical protein
VIFTFSHGHTGAGRLIFGVEAYNVSKVMERRPGVSKSEPGDQKVTCAMSRKDGERCLNKPTEKGICKYHIRVIREQKSICKKFLTLGQYAGAAEALIKVVHEVSPYVHHIWEVVSPHLEDGTTLDPGYGPFTRMTFQNIDRASFAEQTRSFYSAEADLSGMIQNHNYQALHSTTRRIFSYLESPMKIK